MFEGLISEGKVIVYLDNILIFTETLEEHWKVVKKVVSLLYIHTFFLKPEKCKFKCMEIEYLGVRVSPSCALTWVQVDSEQRDLKNILTISRLGLPQTCVGSKCLIMQTLVNSSRTILEPDYYWRSWKGKSQVATQTSNLLYYFCIIYYHMSYHLRSLV